tara:strand:- start:445 stop:1098 length:654 start_codon:yes stop_codon:yes gene_type:complete
MSDIKKGLICGRGRSLGRYPNLFDHKYEFVCLINEFNQFIREDSLLLRFLKEKSENGFLTQQVNIEGGGVDSFLLESLDVKEITMARLAYNGSDSKWRPLINTGIFDRFGMTLTMQPDSLEPYMHHIKNSLGIAILNMIVDKKCSKIDIIGSDFYEADYFLSHRGPDWAAVSQKNVQDRLKKGIDKLIEIFPDVVFNIYTCSSYENNSDNCYVIKIK